MDTQSLHSVTLPDGGVVETSDSPQPWWRQQNGTGFVHPKLLAPDPDQPRLYIDPVKLEELTLSVRTSGVRQTLVVTPLEAAPWLRINPEATDAFFGIVSGHRRRASASVSDLQAVPIEVRYYASAKEFYMDASILNEGQEGLAPLEEGYNYVRLREVDWTVEEICEHYGKSLPYYYLRVNLTYLHPGIQALLSPTLTEHKRLPSTTAGALGHVKTPTVDELDEILEALGRDAHPEGCDVYFEDLDDDGRRFELQWMFLRVILKHKYKSVRAIKLIKEHSEKLAAAGTRKGGRKSYVERPDKKRQILGLLASGVTGSVVVDWTPKEFAEIFATATDEDLEAHVKALTEAVETFQGFNYILKKLQAQRASIAA